MDHLVIFVHQFIQVVQLIFVMLIVELVDAIAIPDWIGQLILLLILELIKNKNLKMK